MAFHSFAFLFLFLPVFLTIYHLADRYLSRTAASCLLLLASVAFYWQSGPQNLLVISASLFVNHWVARMVARTAEEASGRWLAVGIAFNVLLLGWFKYSGIGLFGRAAILPLGISFFTIQQVRYLMDIREKLAGPDTLFDHAQTIVYFPNITAGPITRPRDMVSQFRAARTRDRSEDLAIGFVRLVLGLAKKTVIADNLALIVTAGYDAAGKLGVLEALLVCCCCTLQVYFDFSGYSDMAIGIALMLGHTLPENFDNPLRARSITEFWQRWHMTLTGFITTYLYTPLLRAFGKVTRPKAMAATMISMTIAGVWHGSGVVFLIFGILHGAGLCAHLAWKASKRVMPDAAGTTLTFLFVSLAFIFFRSPGLTAARDMVSSLAGLHGFTSPVARVDNPVYVALRSNLSAPLFALVTGTALAFLGPASARIAVRDRLTPRLAFGLGALIVLSVLFMNSNPDKGFIYAAF